MKQHVEKTTLITGENGKEVSILCIETTNKEIKPISSGEKIHCLTCGVQD